MIPSNLKQQIFLSPLPDPGQGGGSGSPGPSSLESGSLSHGLKMERPVIWPLWALSRDPGVSCSEKILGPPRGPLML